MYGGYRRNADAEPRWFIYLLPALPAQWKEGSVNGIIARGGFELDLSWKNGKVSRLVVKSRHGGNCRLRSLNPLAGKGLRKAKGENPNKLYAIPEILQPIINKEAKLNKVELKKLIFMIWKPKQVKSIYS